MPCETNDLHSFDCQHKNKDGEFAWDEYKQGIILGSFFWGYVLTQIPGGRLAELFGGRKLLGYGILSTSVFTLLTPFAARASDTLLIFCRVLMGLGEVIRYCRTNNTGLTLLWMDRSRLTNNHHFNFY